ncbi:MAG: hypothetical protein KW793_04955 [Candidatus Doudnabacteria bacterium]|nr:hypothetical protein [Candidatus Doudnabacteria bacterium]
MAKKKEEVIEQILEKKSISELITSYGNGDLNELRDKINEVIKYIKPQIFI